ncbi:neuraminidase-like domain-containing protein [Pseudomonas sp. SJZ080]|uniref:Tc toxin subunit A-related protein n=1 Tax=Pseudomonas sp. SJZ080 TaxID=2572888 RepID=UPI002114BFF0|nr:neuraminidase-like domain-containing protein [Pseudomonas sp. SJZ080]
MNGTDGDASPDDAMDLEKVESTRWQLTKTSTTRFDRLQRMIRLQRWTGMSFTHLDTLVMSVIRSEGTHNPGMELNDNTLRALGVYRYLNQHYAIAPEEFAALLDHLPPYASGKGEVPLFDQVFNRVQLFDTPLILDQTVIDLTVTDVETQKTVLQLCAGLGLQPTEDSLLLLAKQTTDYLTTLKRDLPTVSSLYRQARIAQLFGYPVADLLTLAGLLGGSTYKKALASGSLRSLANPDTPDILDVLMQLVWAVDWLKESQQSVAQLQARLGPYVPPAIADLAEGSATETVTQYPPLPDDLSKRLTRLQDDTRASVVTTQQVAALGLPPLNDSTDKLEWHPLLINHRLIDNRGLLPGLDRKLELVDEPIIWLETGLDKLLDAQKLSAEVKQTYKEKLTGLLLSAHDKHVQLLEGLFQETAKLPVDRTAAVIHWARYSVYSILVDAFDKATDRLFDKFQRVLQHAEIIVHLRLSDSALRMFLINPDWLGADQYDDSGSDPTLACLYLLESFSRWLHAQSESEDTVLSYFSLANSPKPRQKNKALRKVASETANAALARLLAWSEEEVATLTFTLDGNQACSMKEVDWIRRCQTTCQASGLSAKSLLQATRLNQQSELDDWKVVGHAVMTPDSADLSLGLDAPLNESLRDAMLALYLNEVVPCNPYLIEKGLTEKIKTADDLYEFWLLDVQVSQNVPTSPVACAIASLQQLINAIMMNMEPGYGHVSITAELEKTWSDGLNRYPIWAAMQQLHYFPDIYLDPNLRLTTTDSFEQLKNDINQARIEPKTVQTAILAYLARFEEVSNVQVCNGYINGEDFANATYYFIGKSPSENAFFWRSLDMSQRAEPPTTASGNVPKFDKPLPRAWTDWKRANVPISEKALLHTVRACWFNNRLFIVWVEFEYQDPNAIAPVAGALAENTVKLHPRFRLYGSYKKYDDNWSTPRVYIDNYCLNQDMIEKTPEEIAKQTHTIAVYNHWNTPESLFLALYSNYTGDVSDTTGGKDRYDFLRTVRIDKNFNVTALYPKNGQVGVNSKEPLVEDDDTKEEVQLIGRIFAGDNAGRFQYRLPVKTNVFGDVADRTPTEISNVWNYGDWQSRIKPSHKDVDIVYNRVDNQIELTLKLNEGFNEATKLRIILHDRSNPSRQNLSLSLVYYETDLQNKGTVTLLEGSYIRPIGTDFFENAGDYMFDGAKGYAQSFIKDPNKNYFTLPDNPEKLSMSLKDKIADSRFIKILFNESQLPNGDIGLALQVLGRTIGQERMTLNFASAPISEAMDVTSAYSYKLFIAHPYDINTPAPASLAQMHALAETAYQTRLAKDVPLKLKLYIDQNTLNPGWPGEWPDLDKIKIPLIYGVVIADKFPFFGWQPLGGALRALTVGWGAEVDGPLQIAPSINDVKNPSVGDSPSLGKAQFIDFKGSSIAHSEVKTSDSPGGFPARAAIRMNTTFPRQLIEYAELGMEHLLGWETQMQKTDPPLPPANLPEAMDFSGAYHLYFLELFLYLPWLVASRLNEEQRYDEAKSWLAYLFNPARQSKDPGSPGYWQAVPLIPHESPHAIEPSRAVLYPDDPHEIALSAPEYLRKALYRLYLDIEGNQGDQAYMELTPDGLAEAKLRYVHILDLLGRKPDVRQVDDWKPITLLELGNATNQDLREFEQRLIADQRALQQNPPLRIGRAPESQAAPLLCLLPTSTDTSLSGVDNHWLRRPFNPELIKCWERAESRLFHLRHNLDMAGNELNLPLFAKPLDPRALLAAWSQGLSGAALSRLLSPQIPHYRFSFMFALAQNAVESVVQFGSTLLSLIERKEQAQYLELQQQQAWNLAKVAVDIQTQALNIDLENKKVLEASKASIEARVIHHSKLAEQWASPGEIIAGSLKLVGRVADTASLVAAAAGQGSIAVPNIIGLATGGHRTEGPFNTVAQLSQMASLQVSSAADAITLYEQYRLRLLDRTHAHDQAKLELKQINSQLAVYEEQHKATGLQLGQAQTALEQARATHEFLLSNNRFSKSQTYNWLNSKFASFYYTAYTTAQSLCQAAEACWQYEMGNYGQTFIQPGAWNSSYRGLGAGEELKTSLQQMHREYLQNNKRELEIRKTVSLKNLKAKHQGSVINKEWGGEGGFHEQLKAGSCTFELTQEMFDDDYQGQGHFMRRIRSISVSLPNVRGPHEDICAILEQTWSKVEMSATVGATPKDDKRPHQQIAISTGVDDNGLFQLNFQDERYLPFEFSGAVSKWTLTFPNPEAQKACLESLTDVIIHILYTARRGGGTQ